MAQIRSLRTTSVSSRRPGRGGQLRGRGAGARPFRTAESRCCGQRQDRKSTRLNSSHGYISYAVFCLKKKKDFRRRSVQMLANIKNYIDPLIYNKLNLTIHFNRQNCTLTSLYLNTKSFDNSHDLYTS